MAINMTGQTAFGIPDEHNVLTLLNINRHVDLMTIIMDGYIDITGYTNDKVKMDRWQKDYTISNLPTSLKTILVDLKDEIETLLTQNEPQWSGGTITDDRIT